MLNIFKSRIIVSIKGKNVDLLMKKIISNKIELLSIKNNSYNEKIIQIYYYDYERLLDIKGIYNIDIIKYLGLLNFIKALKFNKYIISFIVIGFIIIYFLSNLIFEIEVITNDNIMKNKIINILKQKNIKKYKYKKSYNYLQNVKSIILNKYKDEIEWIEIENIGTKYIIRYEPRVIKNKTRETNYRHIVALKDAIIYDVDASKGEILKKKNDYVKKGDIIVSGYIHINENIKDTVSSTGHVFGEVWYTVTVSYPFKYYEKIKTGKENHVLTVNLLNTTIELFNFNKYKYKISDNNTIFKNNLLPFSLNIQHQKEIEIRKENNTLETAIKKAIELGKKKITASRKNDEYIIDYKILNKIVDKKEVTLKLFFSVCEDITAYQEIDEYQEEEINENSN